MILVLELIFAGLSKLNANVELVGSIIAGGYEAFKKAKEALANTSEPTLEQLHAKWAELREPVDL